MRCARQRGRLKSSLLVAAFPRFFKQQAGRAGDALGLAEMLLVTSMLILHPLLPHSALQLEQPNSATSRFSDRAIAPFGNALSSGRAEATSLPLHLAISDFV